MLRNFFRTAVRSLIKNRVYSIINIIGLSVCFTATFFIAQYVHFETSFDSYHTKQNRIFRVGMQLQYENSSITSVGSYYGIGEQSQIDFSVVEDYFTTTHNRAHQGFLGHEKNGELQSYRLNGYFATSPSILKILDFEFLEGDSISALSGISNVVITKSLAERIFGKESSLGKPLTWFNSAAGPAQVKSFLVGAVVSNPPENTHFDFDILVPLKSFEAEFPEYKDNLWTWYGYYNYLLLKKPADKQLLEANYPNFVSQHLGDRETSTYVPTMFLEPLHDIHLKSNAQNQITDGGDAQTVNILILVSVLLIILAYTNYINLVTSLNLQRVKEVGIRKTLGSNKKQVFVQFLMETVMVSFIAFGIALIFIYALKSFIPNWIEGYPKSYLWNDINFWIISIALVMTMSLISGSYPSWLVVKFKNIEVLNGNFSQSSRGKVIHKLMVVLQFSITSVLILFSIVINRQLQFMLDENLGPDIDQVFVARAPFTRGGGSFESAIRTFQNDAERIPEISAVAASTAIPGIARWGNSVKIEGKSDEGQVMRRMEIDEHYLDVYRHELITGRGFSKDFGSDQNSVILNEKAAEIFGFSPEDILNKNLQLSSPGDKVKIIGVIKDYNHNSMKSEILPMIMTKSDEDIYFVSLRLQTSDLTKTLKELEELWQENFPGSPIDGFFANENFERLYSKEQKLGKIITAFTSVALLIACLGIFGLSLFSLLKKRKEIGVRKVLGAPSTHLAWIFTREIAALILIAGTIGIPSSYWLVNNWLESFPNRVEISIISMILPLIIIISLTFITIAYNTFKALRINPVDTLRHE